MLATPKKTAGAVAEEIARHYLETHGLRFVEQNYHCAAGEIDLIMQDNEDIVFVEVRSRASHDYGTAVQSIHSIKQKKIIKSAILYLQKKNWLHKVNCRFDAVGVSPQAIEWIKNAFIINHFY